MAARSRYGCVDPLNPEAAGRCDRGGEIRRLSELGDEMRWVGNRLVATGLRICAEHRDLPQPQDRVPRLRPDPVPVRDPRPVRESWGTVGATPNPPPPPPTGAEDSILDDTFILDESDTE